MHRTLIVGRGLIGSAAARHLSAMQDGVLVVGPDEPAQRAGHDGVFASHYDEGRITRISDAERVWAVTAARSIGRYADIEARSGIRFYRNVGFLGIEAQDGAVLQAAEAHARSLGADVSRLDAAGIASGFPFLDAGAQAAGLHERAPAGHISPRALVRAQTAVAQQQGAEVLTRAATALRTTGTGIELETDDGRVHRAERALIATGAFTDASGLVSRSLDLRVFGRTVVLARVDDALAGALAGMPTLVHVESGAYILPPIEYPDGQRYVKIGIGSPEDVRLRSMPELSAWFKGAGSDANRRDFRAFITALIPALADSRDWHTDTCAVTQTASGLPYLDFVLEGRVAVAVGGNGKGAKSSDDWGLLAAGLIAGRPWEHPVPREVVRLPPG